ncbi:MAG: hypothetical protein IJ725_01915, partial [Ruminococcus sp.]|nr:hypothetical protein [Ruminococcus sp.]
ALVALGSATFAWYSINRTVGADDLTVKASTPGGLQISDNNSDWESGTITWTDSATLQPSTWTATATAPGYTGLQVSDSDSVSSATAGQSLVDAPLAASNYVLAKTIYLKNTNSVAGLVKGTVTSSNVTGSYMRMKVVDASDGTVYLDINSHTDSVTDSTGFKLAKNADSAQKTFYVIVYADGQDANCTTNNATDAAKNADIDFDISFTMTDTTD